MKRTVISFAALCAICFVFNAPAFAQPVKPGLWRSTSKMTVNGQAMPMDPSSDDDECVTPEQAKDMRAMEKSILSSAAEDGGECKTTEWKHDGTTLRAAFACRSKEGTSTLRFSGPASATAYSLKGQIKGNGPQTGAYTADFEWTGKWVGACR